MRAPRRSVVAIVVERDAPAEMAADAVLIDRTDLTIEAAVEKAIAAVEAAMARGNRA